MLLQDSTPIELLDTVRKSLRLVLTETMPSLVLYLANDIDSYNNILQKIAQLNDSDIPPIDLNVFKKIAPRISPIGKSINIDGRDFKFQNIKLINGINQILQQFEPIHSVIINSAEHIYCLIRDGIVYILAIPNAISKIYRSIEERLNSLMTTDDIKSYPTQLINSDEISDLNNFNTAVENISIHRDISIEKATNIFTNWLRGLPRKFHQSLVTLIFAHIVMTETEIQKFLKQVNFCIENKEETNPFLIKHIADYNGTHRICYKTPDVLGRKIKMLEPLKIRLVPK